jgi:hypothetical protein
MSINLSEPVTTDGALKLTQAEYDYLNSFLAVKDRGGYYLALYNMTGSQEALLQAQITTFSEGAGGAAYVANTFLKSTYSDRYTKEIYDISQLVAQSSLDAISRSQTPVWECLVPSSAWCVNKQNRLIFMLITIKHQAELEGRHSQARAWERDNIQEIDHEKANH